MTKKEQEFLYQSIGNQIRFFRENSGFSQSDLAAKLDLSRASIVNIEKGRQNPSLHLLLDLSRILDINFTDFFTDEIWKNDASQSKLNRIDSEIKKMTTVDGRLKVNEFLKKITS